MIFSVNWNLKGKPLRHAARATSPVRGGNLPQLIRRAGCPYPAVVNPVRAYRRVRPFLMLRSYLSITFVQLPQDSGDQGDANRPPRPPENLLTPSWLKGLRPLKKPRWAGLRTTMAGHPAPEGDFQGKAKFPLGILVGFADCPLQIRNL